MQLAAKQGVFTQIAKNMGANDMSVRHFLL